MAISVTQTKAGRPRATGRTKASECEWIASSKGEKKRFTSKGSALRWLAERPARDADLKTYRWLIRAYELHSDDEQGLHWRKFELRGPDPAELEKLADERVKSSALKNALQVFGDRSLSEAVPEPLRGELAQSVEGWYEAADASAYPTVRQIIEEYLERQVKLGLMGRGTRDTRMSCLEEWVDRKFEHEGAVRNLAKAKISELDQRLLESWVMMVGTEPNRYATSNSRDTVKRIVGVVRTAWQELKYDQGVRDIFDRVDFGALTRLYPRERSTAEAEEAPQQARERFEVEQVKALIKASEADAYDRALLALVLAGCRSPGEPGAARWDDLETEHGILWWDPTHSVDKVSKGDGSREIAVTPRTKTGAKDVRTLPLTAWQAEALEALRGKGKFILGQGDEPADPEALQRRFDALMRRAGVAGKGLSINSGRHTVLTFTRQLPDGERRSRLLGHAKPGRDTVAKHYDRTAKSEHRALLMDREKSVADLMTWWS